MWRIINGGIDTITSIPQAESTVFSLDFADGSIVLERVPEDCFGDLEPEYSAPAQDMLSQSLEPDTQLTLPISMVKDWTSYSRWE